MSQAAESGAAIPVSTEASEGRLPLRTVVLFSLPPLGAGYMFFLILFYLLKFATDVLLIAPAAMGAIFMAGRIWDAVSDPVAGYWSDRTRTRLGRRRPWLLASALPIGLAFVMIWSPPASLTGAGLVTWMAVAVLGFYSAMTILIVPHTSLGAELTTSYHDRTRVFGVRQVAWYLGMFLTLLSLWALTASEDPRSLVSGLAVAAAAGTALLIATTALRLHERSEFQGRGGRKPYRAFADVLRNPHARLLLVVYLVESCGGATVGVLTIYFSEYVLGTPHLTTFYIGAYIVCATASIPAWVALSRRVGKKGLWCLAMSATGVLFGATFLLGRGDAAGLLVIAALLGVAAGSGNVIGPSIQADVIDWDEWRTHERKEGAYFAAWNFVFKMATGLTLGITGFVLQATGFEPNVEQEESARFAIRALYGLFPLACYAMAALLLLRFDFNEEEYAAVRAEIDSRGEAPSGDRKPPGGND